jgi:hypothetical protein
MNGCVGLGKMTIKIKGDEMEKQDLTNNAAD